MCCHIFLSWRLGQESGGRCFLNWGWLLCYGYFLLTRCWDATGGEGLPSLTSELLLQQPVRVIEGFLIVLFFEDILQFDSRLNVDNLDCAIVRSLVSFSVPLVLNDDLTVDAWVAKHALVQRNKLTVYARVNLEILRTLNADSLEELVVEGIQSQVEMICLCIDFTLFEDFLSLVCHKAPSTDPEQARVDRQQAVAHVIALGRRLDYLQRSVVSYVPDDELVRVIHREHERPFLD